MELSNSQLKTQFKHLSNLNFSALTTMVKEMHNSMNKIKDDSDYTIM